MSITLRVVLYSQAFVDQTCSFFADTVASEAELASDLSASGQFRVPVDMPCILP